MPNTYDNTFLGTAVAHKVIAAEPRSLNKFYCTNGNAAVRYLMFFDQTADLSGGEVPVSDCVFVLPPAVSGVPSVVTGDREYLGTQVNGTQTGRKFEKGIVFGISTTLATFTAATATDHILSGDMG